jgi:hypothetical protein
VRYHVQKGVRQIGSSLASQSSHPRSQLPSRCRRNLRVS